MACFPGYELHCGAPSPLLAGLEKGRDLSDQIPTLSSSTAITYVHTMELCMRIGGEWKFCSEETALEEHVHHTTHDLWTVLMPRCARYAPPNTQCSRYSVATNTSMPHRAIRAPIHFIPFKSIFRAWSVVWDLDRKQEETRLE